MLPLKEMARVRKFRHGKPIRSLTWRLRFESNETRFRKRTSLCRYLFGASNSRQNLVVQNAHTISSRPYVFG